MSERLEFHLRKIIGDMAYALAKTQLELEEAQAIIKALENVLELEKAKCQQS